MPPSELLPPPGPTDPLYVPNPEQVGLGSFFWNVRKSAEHPDGIEDGMTLVVAEARSLEDETVQETWERIGAAHVELAKTKEYKENPGPLDMQFWRDHWHPIDELEPIIAPTSERTVAGMQRHIGKIVTQNEHHIEYDTPTHIGLSHPHVGSGGRYNRPIWGWDTDFNAAGYLANGDRRRVRQAAENERDMIDKTGTLANSGLRVIADRPHLPFTGHTISKLMALEGPQVLTEFLPTLVKNWSYWTAGRAGLAELPYGKTGMSGFSFLLDDGSYLEGVGSTGATPRPEMYREDVVLAHMRAQAKQLVGPAYEAEMKAFYDNVRGGALMGNDFFGGQCADGKNLYTIDTVGRMSVPINSLLAYDEFMIADGYRLQGDEELARYFHSSALARVNAINNHLFNPETNTYQDRYKDSRWAEPDANMAYPLYVGITSSPDRIDGVRMALEDYVQKGGVLTTLNTSEHNWGAPSDWAMTAHVVIRGLGRASHALAGGREGALALKLAERAWNGFILGSLAHFQTTGQVGERVNALDPTSPDAVQASGQYENISNFPTRGLVWQGLLKSHPSDRTGGRMPFGFTIRDDFRNQN